MTATLLQTKLHIPPLHPALLNRERLLGRLDEGLPRNGAWRRQLTLISAPAGYGKTTLAAAWIAKSQIPAAWLTLDRGDNDRGLFMAYLFTSLQRLSLCLDAELSLAPVHSSEVDLVRRGTTALVHFLNACAACDRPFVLALDDYHLIEEEEVHQAVAYILTHLPPQMHLLLATRADPPLPVVRLRGQGQVAEIRQADLRFTQAEARAFFAGAMALAIPPTELETLTERTEGWAAGLQMAALALRHRTRQDPQATHAFVHDFAGTHRHILDYLLEEVLERQPAPVQSFLLQTSILEALSAELCQAVVAGSGTLAETQTMLEYLEGANLFVAPLDDQRCWYRYHQLFADLLRVRLAQRDPALVPDLYRRAARWYEEQGMLTDAVQAALAAGDLPHVSSLAERNVLGLMEHGDVKALARWLDALPPDAVAQHSWLRLAQGWALAYTGRLPAAQIAATDVAAAASTAGADANRPQLGHVAALRAYVDWLQGNHEESIELARDALAGLPPHDTAARCMAATTLGNAQLEMGWLDEAGRSFREALALGRELPYGHLPLFATGSMAYYLLNRGQLHEAGALCKAAIERASRSVPFGRDLPALALIYAMWGTVQRHWHQLNEALACTRRALSLAQQWGQIDMITLSSINLASALAASGEYEEALAYLQAARELVASMASPWFESILTVSELAITLQQGDLTRAAVVLNRLGVSAQDNFDYFDSDPYKLLAFYLLAAGEADEAGQLLARLLPMTEAAGAHREFVNLLLLQARVTLAQGARAEAAQTLERVLGLAAPENLLSPFIAPGPSLLPLLRGSAGRVTPAFTQRILAVLGESADVAAAVAQPLVEPLSKRELDVLQLLGEGRSNREIGLTLSISLATVKWHTSNIYGKLGVGSRTEAVLRAQQLGLLP